MGGILSGRIGNHDMRFHRLGHEESAELVEIVRGVLHSYQSYRLELYASQLESFHQSDDYRKSLRWSSKDTQMKLIGNTYLPILRKLYADCLRGGLLYEVLTVKIKNCKDLSKSTRRALLRKNSTSYKVNMALATMKVLQIFFESEAKVLFQLTKIILHTFLTNGGNEHSLFKGHITEADLEDEQCQFNGMTLWTDLLTLPRFHGELYCFAECVLETHYSSPWVSNDESRGKEMEIDETNKKRKADMMHDNVLKYLEHCCKYAAKILAKNPTDPIQEFESRFYELCYPQEIEMILTAIELEPTISPQVDLFV